MALDSETRRIRESTTAIYQATLINGDNEPIQLSDITTLTLTLYDVATGQTINSREDQDIKNNNGVTLANTTGILQWTMTPADNTIIATHLNQGESESHVALFQWFYNGGKAGRHEQQFDIIQVTEIPISLRSTIIASWGGSLDNSFVSFTQASSYCSNGIVNNSAWTNASPSQKIAALLEATRTLDQLPFVGRRYYYDQNLSCPRDISQSFPYNRTSSSSSVFSVMYGQQREDIRRATCHQACFILSNNGTNQHSENLAAGVQAVSKRVGPIAETYTYGKSTSYAKKSSRISPEALDYLRRWLTSPQIIRA